MAKNGMFESAVRSNNDRAGVVAYDGDTGYFYLYNTKEKDRQKVVGAIRVLTKTPDFGEKDVAIRWDSTESKVGLFVRGQLWAAFDVASGAKYAADCHASNQAEMPSEIVDAFKSD